MRKNGVLSYLHGDHLGSTFATTNSSGTVVTDQGYYAYGRYRRGGALPTDHKFTGQKLDGTGLQYFNARYYDPELGQFLSPDTLVPDPGNLFDYNRYMYVRGNLLRFNDPTGHQCTNPSNNSNTDYDSCTGITPPYFGGGSTSSNRAPAPSTGGGFFSSIGSALRAAGSRLSSWWQGADQSQITQQQAQKSAVNNQDIDDVPVPGTVSFMSNKDQFYKNAQKRTDVDPNGFLDVIAHGSSTQVEVTTLNGTALVNHRTFRSLIEQQAEYTGQPIRLLSCSTGACSNGFAQNLANKLNTTVRAPSDILWAHPNGNLTIGPSPYVNTGTWIDFVPSPTK